MAGNCAIFRSWNSGDTLTASDLTTSFTTVGVTNQTPQCIDDYSATDVQMQTTVDPYPASVISLPTSLAGELERIRYVLKKLGGWSQWYAHTESAATAQLRQTFNGLHLRTHRDNDVRKTTVALHSLRSVVMSDGTGYSDVVIPGTTAPLTALITGSGAAGLDTGSEQASTWYSIRLIGKSSTKAVSDLRLIFHRERNLFTDSGQSFTTAPNAARSLRLLTSTATDKLAQGFQSTAASSQGKIDYVDVVLVRTGSPTGNVWFTIETDNAGSPSGTVQATSDKRDVMLFSTGTEQTIRFFFSSPFTPTQSTQYHLVLQGDYAKSDTVFIGWRGVAAGGYANGVAKEYNGAAWSNASGVGDFYFKVYTRLNDTSITYPSGYDQECVLGYVRNDSGSDFEAFDQHEHYVKVLTNKNSNAGSGVFTRPDLVDATTFVPDLPTILGHFHVRDTTAATSIRIASIPEGSSPDSTGTAAYTVGAGYTTTQGAEGGATYTPVVIYTQALYMAGSGTTSFMHMTGWEW
jgi:hypothetical protein